MNYFSLELKCYIEKDLNLKAFFRKSNIGRDQQKTMRIVKCYVQLKVLLKGQLKDL